MSTGFGIYLGVMIAMAVIITVLQLMLRCDCGKTRPPYLFPRHERAWTMLLWVPYFVPSLISAFLGLNYGAAIINSLLVTWHVYRWWLHEKDKIKKKLRKLAARVSLSRHGRLVVTNN